MRSAIVFISILSFQLTCIILLGQWRYDQLQEKQRGAGVVLKQLDMQHAVVGKSQTKRLPVKNTWRDSKDYYMEKLKTVLGDFKNDIAFQQLSREERQSKIATVFLAQIADEDFRLMPEHMQRDIMNRIMLQSLQ